MMNLARVGCGCGIRMGTGLRLLRVGRGKRVKGWKGREGVTLYGWIDGEGEDKKRVN